MNSQFNLTIGRKIRLGLFTIAAIVMLVRSVVDGNANTEMDKSGFPDTETTVESIDASLTN